MSAKATVAVSSALYPGASLMNEEEIEAVARVMRSRNLFRYYGVSGTPNEVADYEREWEAYAGRSHALAVNSGTSALLCALVAAGVKPGDEVILPAFAWVSVPNAIIQAGALPVVVDVDDALGLDPSAVARNITPRTAAILPVHMRGAPCSIGPLIDVASAAGVAVVEDACQAAGVTYGGRPAGSFGLTSAFSTQYAKIVSTGEGGAVLTDDYECYLAALDVHDPANALRRGEEPSSYPGFNMRCTEIQAAIGRVQLRRLGELVERTRGHASHISAVVQSLPGLTLRASHDRGGGNGVAVIFFAPSAVAAQGIRDELRGAGVPALCLHEDGITDLHVAASWKTAKAARAAAGSPEPVLKRSFDLLARAVQIDVHPLYTEEDVVLICAAIERAAAGL